MTGRTVMIRYELAQAVQHIRDCRQRLDVAGEAYWEAEARALRLELVDYRLLPV